MDDPYQPPWPSVIPPMSTGSTDTYPWFLPATNIIRGPAEYSSSVVSSSISVPVLHVAHSTSSRSSSCTLELGLPQETGQSGLVFNRAWRPAKRRGPKPDSKPATTRRQELNRQAQRTHRIKKENHTKILEKQNVQLNEAYNKSVDEKAALLEENRRLEGILQSHGIDYRDHSLASSLTDSLNLPADHSRNYQIFRATFTKSPAPSIENLPSLNPNEY